MKDICRNTLSIWLAVLLIVGICGISWAQPDEDSNAVEPDLGIGPQCRMGMGPQCNIMPSQNEGFPMGVPLEVLYSGHGLALRGNESHNLRLKVEAIMPMQPDQIRDLLSSNKSLEEIRDDIRTKGEEAGDKAFRGSMILDRSMYPLVNIDISSSGNTSTIKADLVDISKPPSNHNSALGNLSVVISPSDSGMIGEGELNILEEGGKENYSLSLDMEPPRQRQRENGGRGP